MASGTKTPSSRDFRPGLLRYGGVSLAIYMHGIIKEIQKLLVASPAYKEPGHLGCPRT